VVAQTRWLQAETGAPLAGQRQILEFKAQRAMNAHGLRVEINIESEAQDANSNGHWAVYRFPGDVIVSSQTLNTWATFDDENITQYLWGVGLWMASNQTPFHTTFAPDTTRNLMKGGRIFVVVWVEGTLPILTANRVNILLNFFASQ